MNLRPAEPSAGGSGRVVNEPTSSEPATKAVFGTAVAMLKRDKQKKSRRTPRVKRLFAKRLQRKTQIFELGGGKLEKRVPSWVRV